MNESLALTRGAFLLYNYFIGNLMKIGNSKLKITFLRSPLRTAGFTLAEMLVGSAVFAIIAVAVFQTYSTFINLVAMGKYKIMAADIINEQFELIRNLKYADVGIKNSIPNGVLDQNVTIVRSGSSFDVTRTIRNIDDPFDGLIGGIPNDLSPSDYKLVQIEVSCSNCKNFTPISTVGQVAPKNLESASSNGALFIKVFDANGNPVPQANVHIVNVATTVPIIIDDLTNNQGTFQLVDAPPGVTAYRISATKSGFTTDRTYATSSSNPNPVKPDATVIVGQVTQTSFVIDRLSSGSVNTLDAACGPIANIPFNMRGGKLIGTMPDVLKFDQNYTTDSSGLKNISSLEWDTFNLSLSTSTYYLAGTNPTLPISVLPNSAQNISLILTNALPGHLLVVVTDSSTSLPVSDATLTLNAKTLQSGRGYMEQTDWSGGPGQNNFVDSTKYFSDDSNVNIASPAGDLKLKMSLGAYVLSGVLTSSVFDTGTSSNFGNIFWSPVSQPPQSGANSIRFQIATAPDNTSTTTWNYKGPDGTASTYYSVSNTNINATNNGNRYFRYKVFLTTADTAYTPTLANVAVTFTSACIPPGQAIFSGLLNGSYTLIVDKTGYSSQNIPININSAWAVQNVLLLP